MKIKYLLKKNKIARILYREIYHFWREISVLLFSSLLKKSNVKVITREQLTKGDRKYKILQFGSEEIINLGDFITFKPIPKRVIAKIQIKKLKVAKPFVCELEKVEIIGEYPVAFDCDRQLILETTLPIFNPVTTHIAKNIPIKTILAAKAKPQAIKKPIETACLLVNPWSNNFWHWTVDTLTQLEGVEYYVRQTGIKPKLIVDPNLKSWQRDSLELLGYDEKDLIFWQDYRRTINKLIVPSFRRSYDKIHGEISVAACQWLRKKMLNNFASNKDSKISFSPKVFISRRKALGRRVNNENEVIEALKPLGFVAYVLEEMSYTEQVKLFAQAKVIIAPHGAGLTNLLFAEQPIVLELFGAYVGNEFANLSRSLGFKYGCLACAAPRGEIRVKDGDMVVNVNELLDLLEMALLNK